MRARTPRAPHNELVNKTLSALRVAKPEEWRATVSHAIRESGGNLRVAARTLDVGYSTLKHWCEEDPALEPHNAPGRPATGPVKIKSVRMPKVG
jgi:hypothetical protein